MLRKMIAFVLALALLTGAALAEDAGTKSAEITFRVGQELTLLERDGFSLRLTGGIAMLDTTGTFVKPADIRDESASIGLAVIAENRTGRDLYVEYYGTVNGVALGSKVRPLSLVNVNVLAAGDRSGTWLLLRRAWLGENPNPLQTVALTFRVYEKPGRTNDDNKLLYEVSAPIVRFDRGGAGGQTYRDGEPLTILNQEGLILILNAARVSKGSAYLYIGLTAVNTTGKDVSLTFQARVNGWSLGGYRHRPLNSASMQPLQRLAPGAAAQLILPVKLDVTWAPVRADAELESLELTAEVSQVDAAGNETAWWSAPTGTIWINREPAAETAVASAAPAATAQAAATPAPTEAPQASIPLMYGIAFGDTMAQVQQKAKAAGRTLTLESGALHGEVDFLRLPGQSYDFLFTDAGKLNCLRIINTKDGETVTGGAKDYQNVRAQLVEMFGEPNGRGPTAQKHSVSEQFVLGMKAFIPGLFHDVINHDEWYFDTKPYPIKIDLFYEQTGNNSAGTHGVTVELDIEAQGV